MADDMTTLFFKKSDVLKGRNWDLEHHIFTNPDPLFEECKKLEFDIQPQIKGTERQTHRDIAVFSNTAPGYHLSKQSDWVVVPTKLPHFLETLLEQVNNYFNEDFNLVILNRYNDGQNSIGPHSDDPEFNGKHCVVVMSLGTSRTFRLTHLESEREPTDVLVKHGDVMKLSNSFQRLYKHEIPQCKCFKICRCACKGTRISLTFRRAHNLERRHYNTTVDIKPDPCTVCGVPTIERSHVCARCYAQKLFTCPVCGIPVGANWPCNECYLDQRSNMKKKSLNMNSKWIHTLIPTKTIETLGIERAKPYFQIIWILEQDQEKLFQIDLDMHCDFYVDASGCETHEVRVVTVDNIQFFTSSLTNTKITFTDVFQYLDKNTQVFNDYFKEYPINILDELYKIIQSKCN